MSSPPYHTPSPPPSPSEKPVLTTTVIPLRPMTSSYNSNSSFTAIQSDAPTVNDSSATTHLLPSTEPSVAAEPSSSWTRLTSRWTRVITTLSHLSSTVLSGAMFGLIAYTYATFLQSSQHVINGRTPWPAHPKVWPTLMLLAASLITFLVNGGALIAYCCCFKRADGSWKLTVLQYVVHLGLWLIVSVLYRYEKSAGGDVSDIWGWSCTRETSPLQKEFESVVGFAALCDVQSSSWHLSIVEIVAKVGFAIGTFVVERKKRKGEEKKLVQSLGDATDGLVQSMT
ncbi:MAG: hypothetical protein M1827_003458 [Pycnora praestabilis]|nr:MAG: hypothetical protein M1827_003458 [Pycnora praestabilis]